MVELPLSGVARQSPLGSGGEDPAHPLALRLSEGAVGWAGPPPLSRAWMYLLKGPRGGISNAISSKAAPPPHTGRPWWFTPERLWPLGAPGPVRAGDGDR